MQPFIVWIAGCVPDGGIDTQPPPSWRVPPPPLPGTTHRLAWAADLPQDADTIDVNNDGLLDVVTFDDDRVRLWLNEGGTTFVPVMSSELNGEATLTAVDFDVDGDEDALVGVYSHLWLYDNVGGALVPPVEIASGQTFDQSLSAADVDGDGLPDIAYTSGLYAYWHANLGGGVLGPAVRVTTAHYNGDLSLPDLDGDGDPDMLVADDGAVTVCTNDGAGFGQCPTIALGSSVWALESLDVDFDGDLDVVTARDSGLYWSENLGGLAFANEAPLAPVQYVTDLAAADMDGDGIDDLASTASTGPAGWIPHLVDGTFGAPIELYRGGDHEVLAQDFDADGDVDLFATYLGHTFVENLGMGTFLHPKLVALAEVGGVQCHDFDGDGADDIALSEPWRDRVSWVNRTAGRFAPVGTRQVSPSALAVADLDGDGRDDLVAASSATFGDLGLGWYPNQGGGTFDPIVGVTGARALGVAPFDSDRDGDIDLVVAEPLKVVSMENLGAGASFQEQVLVRRDELKPRPNDDVAFGVPFAADLGGDGYDDVLVPYGVCTVANCFLDYQLQLAWFPDVGGGVVGPPTRVETGLSSMEHPAVTETAGRAADLDADGDIDVLLSVPNLLTNGTPQVVWMENDGSGNLAAPVVIVTEAADPPRAEVLDVDGDGDDDVVVATDAGGMAWFAYNNGAFDRVDLAPFDGRPIDAMSRCDIDADGDQDLVLGGDGVGWWENPAVR